MKLLFVCEGNMMRSQMAEAFYNRATSTTDAMSAGAIAEGKDQISSRASGVMKELGIDTRHLHSKQLTNAMVNEADRIVYFPSDFMPAYVTDSPKAELWEVADPHYNKEKGMEFVRQVRDSIKERVDRLLSDQGKIIGKQ